jgi:carnitine-CoA ligase
VLRKRAKSHGDRVFLEFPETGESYSFSQTLRLSEYVAGNLLRAGAEPGDRVLVMAPNCTGYVFAWFGANLAGMVEVPINNAYRGSYLEHQVKMTAPRLAIIHSEFADRFIESREACGSILGFYILGGAKDTTDAIARLSRAGWKAEPFSALLNENTIDLPSGAAGRLANIFFTSGTTGPSKGVMMPYAQVHLFGEIMVSLTGLTDQDTYMATGPMFHGNTTFMVIQPCLIAGARIVLYEKFSASNWISWVRRCGATHTNFVGVMMDWVWKQPPAPDDAENMLKCICAVPTATSVLEQFRARFGVESFVEIFGSTETCLPLATPRGMDRPNGSCGLLVSDYFDVRIVDGDTDEEVPIGSVGELLVRSKFPWTTCLGYFGMPDKSTDAFRNLWFHTGDGLRQDADGWYYFVDRLKDSLRRRGENISSYELEQSLLRYPGVLECAVIAVPADDDAGEDEVMLFAVPLAGHRLKPEAIWEWSERNLPKFLIPRYIKIIDSLPKTPSQKVQKIELRRMAASSERAERPITR